MSGASHVLGFELINEPFAGNIVRHPRLLLPGVADRVMLQPAYDTLGNMIREADEEAVLFFASVTWDDAVAVGFKHPPGGPLFF
mmetsp:Transcript_36033/g.50042  ORF Transcript_36033/g.50042 Transcript_36033/m.50042 type:complete len:84 (+) Transcript_36033:145-396(+)